jgi:hypothetical protein
MLRLILAIVLIAHGIGHIMGFLAAWTNVPMGFSDRPWLLSTGVTVSSAVGKAFGLLWLVALVAFVVAGLGVLLRADWWPMLAIAGSVVSLIAILPWWNTVASGPRIWASLVDVVTIVVLLVPAWREQLVRALM